MTSTWADGETPKIVDFGLARALVESGGSLEHTLSIDIHAAGTLAYMSPEQREGQPGDFRSDVYAFGLILFWILTGELPQPGDSLTDRMGVEPPIWAQQLFARCWAPL